MDHEDDRERLKAALEECARLKVENLRLKSLLSIPEEKVRDTVVESVPMEGRIALFRSLFRGREDVYPVRWESRTGTSGYSPACANEWRRPLCLKPKIRCSECENRLLLPVTDDVVQEHLSGKHTIGVYPFFLMRPAGSWQRISTKPRGETTPRHSCEPVMT